MSLPLVSVIIPTYNRRATIARAIDSVRAQTYPNIELIVVDDGSRDDTPRIVEAYEGVMFLRQANAGPSAARNTGLRASQGEIIAFLDSDDVWSPDKLARQVELLIASGDDVPCCICDASNFPVERPDKNRSFQIAGFREVPARGFLLNPGEILATRFLLFNQVAAIRRQALDAVGGGFDPGLRLLEDFELAVRLSRLGRWGIIDAPLVQKFNDTNGVGVRAMKDHEVHLQAQVRVFEQLLAQWPKSHARMRRLVQIERSHARARLRAAQLMGSENRLTARWGQLLFTLLRIKIALRRRSPAYPKPNFVDAGPPTAFAHDELAAVGSPPTAAR